MRAPRDWRFLRKPRWLLGTLTIVAMAVVMVNLGLWQLRRLHNRLERNAAVHARMTAPAMPLATALARYRFTVPLGAPDAAAYRHVTARGRYDPGAEVLLRARSLDGSPGYDVLTPLQLPGGRALLVDRGWVPYTDSGPPVPDAAPPTGTVSVTGLLRDPQPLPSGPFKPISPQDPATGPLTKTFYANPQRLQPQMPFTLVGGYLQLLTQSPPQSGELPVARGEPQLGNGPHLSYAIQWFSFTAIVLGGYGAIVWRRSRPSDADGDDRRRDRGMGRRSPGEEGEPSAGGAGEA